MKKSERLDTIKRFVERQLVAGLMNSYPQAIATYETRDLPEDTDTETRLDIWDSFYDPAKAKVNRANIPEILDEYMELEGQLTFYLNWTKDQSYSGKDAVSAPFYEFLEVMQNLGYFEDYYVAFKIPKKGKCGRSEKLNIRVDVLSRY